MSALDDTIAELSAALTGVTATATDGTAYNVPVYTYMPETVTPPFLVIGPDEPWLDYDGPTSRGEMVEHLVAIPVAAAAANEVAAAQIREMTAGALPRLIDLDGYAIERVDQPGRFASNGQAYLATVIRLSRFTRLED